MQRQFRGDDDSLFAYRFGPGSSGSKTFSSTATIGTSDGAYYGTVVGNPGDTHANTSLGDGTYNLFCKLHSSYVSSSLEQNWEYNVLVSVAGGVATFLYPSTLQYSLAKGSQIVTAAPFSDITIDSAVVISPPAWNGSYGGILLLMGRDGITNNGTLNLVSKGYRGGRGYNNSGVYGQSGEGWSGIAPSPWDYPAVPLPTGDRNQDGGGGGRAISNGHAPGAGANAYNGAYPQSGLAAGLASLISQFFGGGGAGYGRDGAGNLDGSPGGGILDLITKELDTSSGFIDLGSLTTLGGLSAGDITGSGSTGAGGSALLKIQSANIGSNKITAIPANSGGGTRAGETGTAGRIHIDYYGTITGTASPTFDQRFDEYLSDLYANEAIFSTTNPALQQLQFSRPLQVGDF